jgi:hypothetical protein
LFFVLIGRLLSVSAKVSDLLPFNVIISETVIRFTSSNEMTDASMSYRLTGALFNVLAAVALHFPMKLLINKKINLK